MEWHLSKGQCTHCCEVVKQTGTAAAYKQTGIKSFRITRILLLALNSVFLKVSAVLTGVYCYIALPFKCMLAVYYST